MNRDLLKGAAYALVTGLIYIMILFVLRGGLK